MLAFRVFLCFISSIHFCVHDFETWYLNYFLNMFHSDLFEGDLVFGRLEHQQYIDWLKRWSRCTGWKLAYVYSCLGGCPDPGSQWVNDPFLQRDLNQPCQTKKPFIESTVFQCLGRIFLYPLSLNYCSNQHFVHPKSPEHFVAQATKTMNSSCTTAVLRYKAMELHAMLSHGVAWLLKRWQTYS